MNVLLYLQLQEQTASLSTKLFIYHNQFILQKKDYMIFLIETDSREDYEIY